MTQLLRPDTVRTEIDNYLSMYYKRQMARAKTLSPDYAELWETMLLVHQAGGKRLRPYMMLLSYQSFGGKQYKSVVPVAAALELIHTFMLIHDDIIDRDYLRHGQLNVAGHYRQRYLSAKATPAQATHLAHSAALLAGDLLIPAAYQLVLESTLSDTQKILAIAAVNDIIFVVGGGEFLDSDTVLRSFETVDPLTVARLKTAEYSFVAPLTLGAKLAKASDSTQHSLHEFGMALGIAFQLTDDLLDIFGDSNLTGKPIASDMQEGKRTYLLCEAYTRANGVQRKKLDTLLGKALTQKQLMELQTILQNTGARTAVETAIATYRTEALAALDSLTLTPQAHTPFEALIALAIDRKA